MMCGALPGTRCVYPAVAAVASFSSFSSMLDVGGGDSVNVNLLSRDRLSLQSG